MKTLFKFFCSVLAIPLVFVGVALYLTGTLLLTAALLLVEGKARAVSLWRRA